MRPFILSDNQAITREGLSSLIAGRWPGVAVIYACEQKGLLDALRRYPDAVVVLDYALFDFKSEQQMFDAMAGAERSSWLLFFDEPNEPFLGNILASAPEVGMVGKRGSGKEILDALICLSGRKTYICDTVAEILKKGIQRAEAAEALTSAEKSVLRGIALGKTTKEIAREKNLSFHTVNTHRRNIFRKLKVNNLHEAARCAFKQGIVGMAEYCCI